MRKYKNTNKVLAFCGMALLLASTFTACKKYANPAPYFEEYGTIEVKPSRRILLISMDGTDGAELQKIAPANIMSLIKTGKYSFNRSPELVSTVESTWASLLTGASSTTHGIIDDRYRPAPSEDDEHSTPAYFPNMLSRILDIKPELKTAVITSDAALNKYLIEGDHRILVSNDALIKDSTINVLTKENPSLVLVSFKDVETAGAAGGYSASVPAYKAAIEKTDAYIAEMTAAIKKRPNFNTEDWLIIVTTNRAGTVANPKAGFIVASNPALKEGVLTKVGFNGMRFGKVDMVGTVKNDNGLYDAGSNKDFTVQVQMKFNVITTYPRFLSKGTALLSDAMTGWTMLQNDGSTWAVIFGGKAFGGSGKNQLVGTSVGNKGWHTLTFTVKTVGNTRIASVFTDGIPGPTANIASTINLSSPTSPLRIGGVEGTKPYSDFYAADLQYFNVALDPAVIKANVALKDVTKHPNYSNLVGYWPFDDGAGSVISNKATTGYNLTVAGSNAWSALGNDIPVSRTEQILGDVSIVPTSPDVAALCLYWLKIPIDEKWGMEGKSWISNYEIEFLKK
ncbi:DUF4983 domain-containing protein [Pedobacter gandavensis]|uniref:DUF4983 domain-containing protein n=1 Tax=Pedobacter gandavensis TaxID=2679963 RepID=UPI00292E20D9|nr:DUF4983 domain-containing protein [Pedobacter gandavensis]